ncbi:MAG: tRNA (adenosine(37)-N6)-threonylcarbamoyltransferase complex dimerization subunit type 1 TsaB [Saprospiraceae bacterium]|nr:tRNA (adenosine(37)-N6)-threonylcarbamoyltransferase complex dimerization subunit type 1 TsaB [Saprospiraceae bacterium]
MPKLLLIETATEVCSIGLWDGSLMVEKSTEEDYAHTSQLTLLIQATLKEAGWQMEELDGVAISAGPGSYTALRVGAATAKGICFAGKIPLIAIDTLESIALAMAKSEKKPENSIFLPMIDARRMEAYTAPFDGQATRLDQTKAIILDAKYLSQIQGESERLVLGGNGAPKCKDILGPGQEIRDISCAAKHLGPLAEKAFLEKKWADLAYFSPSYIKPPNITTPKKIWK